MSSRAPRPDPALREGVTALPGVLDRASLRRLLAGTPPLVEGLLDPEAQLQPNGIDLTLRSVAWFASPGQLGATNEERLLPRVDELEFGADGWLHLAPGPYLMTFNEVVHIPLSLTALTWPRSSLLRSGVALHTAVGDAGYNGRYQALLSVLNPRGFRLAQNARVAQIVFFTLAQPVDRGYEGAYQGEGGGVA